MTLRYTLAALRELDEVLDYIRARSPQGARKVLSRMREIETLIRNYPEGGKAVRLGLRQVAASPYPYVLFYEVAADEVIVHRVRHSARRPLERR